MNTIGIIAEYNPFHAGHAYQINALRQMLPDSRIYIIMSGYFVQRGEPAIFDPYQRAETALENGADAVFMMPVAFSTSSAEEFANAGVRLAIGLGCTHLCFGIEDTKLEILRNASEKSENSDELKKLLKEGMSYPAALARALHLENLSPNNILALEYLKAIKKLGNILEPIAIDRVGHKYNDDTFDENFPSASAIRKVLLSDNADDAIGPDDVLPSIKSLINRLIHEQADLTKFADVSETIANRIRSTPLNVNHYEEAVLLLKTKEYTYSRISRCLIHILLDIKEKPAQDYCILLGFKNNTEMNFDSSVKVISKTADNKELLRNESYAASVYDQVFFEKFGRTPINFYSRKIIKL